MWYVNLMLVKFKCIVRSSMQWQLSINAFINVYICERIIMFTIFQALTQIRPASVSISDQSLSLIGIETCVIYYFVCYQNIEPAKWLFNRFFQSCLKSTILRGILPAYLHHHLIVYLRIQHLLRDLLIFICSV